MQLKLKSIETPTYGQLILYLLLAVVLWSATYIGTFHTYGITSSELFRALSSQTNSTLIWKNIASLVLTLFNALLLRVLIGRFSFIASRTALPVITFVVLITVWEPVHAEYTSHAALTLFIGSLFQFLNMRQNPAAAEKAFLGSLLIACASLLINDLICIMPVCWLGFMFLQSLSARTFTASMLGALAPWTIYCAGIYLTQPEYDWSRLFHIYFSPGFSMDSLMIPTRIYIGVLFILFFIMLAGTYSDFLQKATSTRRNINFMLVMLTFFLLVFLSQDEFDGKLFPFIALCFSIFIANVYSLKKNNFYLGTYLVFLTVNLLFLIFNFIW